MAGNNVESIGINGGAVLDEEAGMNGIWVASVESGSPADGSYLARILIQAVDERDLEAADQILSTFVASP